MPGAARETMQRAHQAGAGVLHVYHPLGFPTPGADLPYLEAAVESGAGVLELGLPFTDPSADGPTLQAASMQAVRAGATFDGALGTVRRLRERFPEVGLVVMAYANALHRRGWDASAAALAKAGADAAIIPDMPLREAVRIAPRLSQAGLDWIPLAASTVPDATLAQLAARGPPFLYAASLGTTGADGPDAHVLSTVGRLAALGVPVAAGFGVRTAAHAATLRSAGATGVVVGSHLVRQVASGATPAQYGVHVRDLAAACRAPTVPV